MAKTCSLDGCELPQKAKSYCNKHYRRLIKYGDPLGGLRCERGAGLLFIKSIIENPGDECIEFPYGRDSMDYGVVTFDGKRDRAHRVSLILATGENPPDKCACHECHTPSCINPTHLYWGTHLQNMGDKLKDGTENLGVRNGQAKINEEIALAVFNDPRPNKVIADELIISPQSVCDIKQGRTWKWLTHSADSNHSAISRGFKSERRL